jgi:hypothetical protein
MKLNKIKLAVLIGWLCQAKDIDLNSSEVEMIDNFIDVDMPQPEVAYPSVAAINDLLYTIGNPDGFIPAIKAYRALTGLSLKEAKEAIERYRVIPKFRDSKPANDTSNIPVARQNY